MMLRMFSLLLPLLVVQAAAGQVLQGRVTDAETGAPLAQATVFLPDLAQGAATDEDGRYRLDGLRAGAYRVVVSFLGFRNETRIVRLEDGPVTLDVQLVPTAVEATPITVTAKAQASDILSTPQAVAVIDGLQLAAGRGAAALDAIEDTPGVRMLRTGPGVAKPVVRGLGAQRVLVVQDGIRQEGQQWGEEHGPELDGYGIDRVEVVKGPASLLYGSDALGGVIQAASADLFGYDHGLGGEASVQAMTNGPLGGGHLRLGGRQGVLAYEADGTWKRVGSFDTPAGVVPNTGLEETGGGLRLGWRQGSRTVKAAYQHYDARIGLYEPDGEEGHGRYAIGEPYQHVAHDRLRLEVNLPAFGHRLDLVGAWQQNRRREFGHGHEEEPGGGHHDDEPDGGHHDDEEPALFLRLGTWTADARLHHRPIGQVFGTVGLSGFYQVNETLGEESLIPGARTANGAAYVFEELVLPRLSVSGGLRMDLRRLDVSENEDLGVDAQTRTYHAFSGAVGAAWQPHSALSLAANVGRAWRAPILIELFAEGVHEGTLRYERGTPTLRPEAGVSSDATLRWLNRHLYVELSGFVTHLDDFIFPRRTAEVDSASGYAVYQYDQAAARLWGGEVTVDLHPHPFDWVHLRLGGDVVRTRNRDTGDPLPFSPPPRLITEVEVEGRKVGGFDRLRFRFGPTFVARQDRIAPLETPTPAYTVWNASFVGVASVAGLRLTPTLAVDNLFDAAYTSHLSRFKPFGLLEPGRNVRFQLSVGFE